MDEYNMPKCSHDPDPIPQDILQKDVPASATESQEITKTGADTPATFVLETESTSNYSTATHQPTSPQLPLVIKPSDHMPVTVQPRISGLSSPMSLSSPFQPQSLFFQALSKLNENSLNFSMMHYLQSMSNWNKLLNVDLKSGDITPPDSLTSAPPSYSFVLRQMAVRRRPRLMGTFIPSPSFVQHTPPPTYATAFDIYVDPGPPPPPRVYTFRFAPMPVICPECGYAGMTVTKNKITLCTHLCALMLCLFFCWICAPLPYMLRSCKDVYHYCGNCRTFLGMYCPTNPENSYPMS
ncbi:uncharacterized protein LOC142985578 [Anticarsia gemmatalis]|uniref:uncharacterized protein LOC142985578 n=1 Tax=Anticarsia gemmatalis TaxID=129554 RepID=UPI003F7766C2